MVVDALFKPYSKEKGVLTFHDLCIEPDPHQHRVTVQKRLQIGDTVDLPQKSLVVYNSPQNDTRHITVSARSAVHVHTWDITFRTNPPPDHYEMITDHPAYFVSTSCPGNLWHYTEDTLFGLFTLIKETNRLHAKERNMVYFREPLELINDKIQNRTVCFNPHIFQDILLSLNVRKDNKVYHKARPNICYKNAVFGVPTKNLVKRSEMFNHVVQTFNMDESSCDQPMITLLQRRRRSVLNYGELQAAANDMGFHSVQVVTFEGGDDLQRTVFYYSMHRYFGRDPRSWFGLG